MSDFKEFKAFLREWAETLEPVFIVGPERSGTSLLFQQVSNHPSFCNFKAATVETFCFVRPWKLLAAPGEARWELKSYLGGEQGWNSFRASIQPLIRRNNKLTQEGMPQGYLYEENPGEIWFERRYKHLIRAFFYHSWLALEKKRIVEKTPAHLRCLPQIAETFPRARIVICTRDPAEIIASHRKRRRKEIELGKPEDDPSLEWLAHDAAYFVNYFKNLERKIRRFMSDSDRGYIVPYGDFTADPERHMAAIFEFLREVPAAVPADRVGRQSIDWDPLLNQPPQKNEVDITQFLSQEDIELVDEARESLSEYWR